MQDSGGLCGWLGIRFIDEVIYKLQRFLGVFCITNERTVALEIFRSQLWLTDGQGCQSHLQFFLVQFFPLTHFLHIFFVWAIATGNLIVIFTYCIVLWSWILPRMFIKDSRLQLDIHNASLELKDNRAYFVPHHLTLRPPLFQFRGWGWGWGGAVGLVCVLIL